MLQSLKTFLQIEGTTRTYWIAFSGGLDSHVLLHLCATLRDELPLKLHAVYINHGLSPHAAKWGQHCEKICDTLKINFQQIIIDAQSINGESPEELARLNRYAAFAELLHPNDFLLTAHQQDDQAETVLLQLFRGAGPKGLAAMPKIKPFGVGYHARPLLNFSRNELKKYAEVNQLQWIEDESNTNTNFTRNFLRHEVIPLLKKRWPTITNTLARSAEHCAEAEHLIEEIAAEDLAQLMSIDKKSLSKDLLGSMLTTQIPFPKFGLADKTSLSEDLSGLTLPHKAFSAEISVTALAMLTPARQRQALRTWFMQLNVPLPSAIKLNQIQQDFLRAREDKLPFIQWKRVELRRFHNKLYLLKSKPFHNSKQEFIWNLTEPLILPHIGELSATKKSNLEVLVRFRQGGEVCQLRGRTYHHELKKLFQLWNVPPWERDRIPLIFIEGKLIAVVGYFLDEAFFLKENIDFYLRHQ